MNILAAFVLPSQATSQSSESAHQNHHSDDSEPGYKSIELKPYPIEGLDWVNCSYDSPYGKIVSNWKRTGDKFEWTVEIPAGTTATALIPGPDSSRESKLLAPGKHHFVTEL